MKYAKTIIIRLILCSGVFFNVTAQDDVTNIIVTSLSEQNSTFSKIASLQNTEVKSQVIMAGVNLTPSKTGKPNLSLEGKQISEEDIPMNITQALTKRDTPYTLLKAEVIHTNMQLTFYKIDIRESDNKFLELLVSEEGEIIMEEDVTARK